MDENQKVVDLDGFRLSRKKDCSWLRRNDKSCKHDNITGDDRGEVFTCDDCNKQISAAWLLWKFVAYYNEWTEKLEARKQKIQEDKTAVLHLTAARKAEEAWRSRTMVPTCPHCRRGISTTDGFGGSRISKEIDQRQRAIAAQRNGEPV